MDAAPHHNSHLQKNDGPAEDTSILSITSPNSSPRELLAFHLLRKAKELSASAHTQEEFERLGLLYERIESVLDPSTRCFELSGEIEDQDVIGVHRAPERARTIVMTGDGHLALIASGARRGQVDLCQIEKAGVREMIGKGLQLKESISCAALSGDNRTLALGFYNGEIKLYHFDGDVIHPEPLFVQPGRAAILSMAFSNDGSTLAVSSTSYAVSFYDIDPAMKTLESLGRYECNELIRSLVFSSDDRHLLCAESENGVRILDLEHLGMGRWVRAFSRLEVSDAALSIDCSHDGTLVAVGCHKGNVLIAERDETGRLQIRSQFEADGSVSSVSFSPDGKYLAIGVEGVDGGLLVLSTDSTGVADIAAYYDITTPRIAVVKFSPSRGYVAVGMNDGTIKFFG